jgi:hypothetical protein
MYRYQKASFKALSGFHIADAHKILLMGRNVPEADTRSMEVRDKLRPGEDPLGINKIRVEVTIMVYPVR